MLLSHLLKGGVASVDDFMESYWQKKTLHIAHGDASWLSDVFNLYDVEELWASTSNAASSSSSSHSAVGGLLIFSETGVKATKALNPFFAFASRCSVVVNRGDRFCAKLRDLCHKLETEAPHFPMACCNVYLTPPDAQSVPKHSDDRDVLLLQVFGEKEWTVYNDPVPLPYRDEEVGKSSPVDEARLTERHVYRIAQGDVLYMPRGFVHEARTNKSGSSLHITVALQTSDWDYASVLTTAIQQVLRSPELRRSRVCCPLSALAADCSRDDLDMATKTMQSILAEVMAHPKLSDFCFPREVFQRRIAAMQSEREAVLDATSEAVPAPIVASSLIMWNPTIEIEGIEPLGCVDPNVPKMQYIVHCSRMPAGARGGSCVPSTSDPPRDHMKFGVTDEMLRCIRWLSKHANAHPVQVRQLPMFDELGRIALCVVLINNMSCLRVT